MRAVIPAHLCRPKSAEIFQKRKATNEPLLAPLLELAENSDSIIAGSVGEFEAGGELLHIPRLIFMGPKGGGDTIRLGVFATIRGDEPAGAKAIASFLQQLESDPGLSSGYHIYAYPICNPSGLAAGTRRNAAGHDLAAHFWCGSNQPEAYYLEREMGVHLFQGVISLGGTDHDQPRFLFSGGRNSILRAALASPAMPASRLFLADAPLEHAVSSAAIQEQPVSQAAGFLTGTNELRAVPFEINFEIPRQAPERTQIIWMVNALKSILDSYRAMLAIRQNI
jgi:murein peptide amidase A